MRFSRKQLQSLREDDRRRAAAFNATVAVQQARIRVAEASVRDRINIADLRERKRYDVSASAFLRSVALTEAEFTALLDAVEAARAFRGNQVMPVASERHHLDAALARFDFGDGS